MRIYYYYHISKTGGTSMADFFAYASQNIPRCVLYEYNDWDKLAAMPKDIDFDTILSDDNLVKYDYIFIHHHHGYHGLMMYKEYLMKRKEELKGRGHSMKILTTIRDVLPLNNSRINYLLTSASAHDAHGRRWTGNLTDFLTDERHFNIQTKYLFDCWHGEWDVNKGIREKDIDTLSEVIDLFINTSNLSHFIKLFSEHLNLVYDYDNKRNTTVHNIDFNGHVSELMNNNKLDCYLLAKYSNVNFQSEANAFFTQTT